MVKKDFFYAEFKKYYLYFLVVLRLVIVSDLPLVGSQVVLNHDGLKKDF